MTAIDELGDLVRDDRRRRRTVRRGHRRHGRGSGFVVAPGRVLTNAHNLRDQTTEVRFADGRTAQGAVVGSDVDGDLVVLDVDTGAAPCSPGPTTRWPPATSSSPSPPAATAGAPPGARSRQPRPSSRPRGRPIMGAIEHTSPWPPARRVPRCSTAGPGRRHQHPPTRARLSTSPRRRRTVTRGDRAMVEGRRFERLRLGVALAPGDVAARLRRSVGLGERGGLLVPGVVTGSPAAAAGIREGDLSSRRRRDLRRPDDLFAVLGDVGAGSDVVIGSSVAPRS